jgi:hypothetical protein
MFSSLPGLRSSLSSQSSADDIVSRSSTVISSLRGPGFANGRRSERYENAGAATPGRAPRPIAIPTASEVSDFVADRVSCSVSAPAPSKYASCTIAPPWIASTLVVLGASPRAIAGATPANRAGAGPGRGPP